MTPQDEIEELKSTIKDLEKERDDLLDKVEQYRDILQGYAIDMQAELRRMR